MLGAPNFAGLTDDPVAGRHHTRRCGSLLTRSQKKLRKSRRPRVPGSPFSRDVPRPRQYRGQLAVRTAALATATKPSPYVLGQMINALTVATQSHGDWATLTPHILLFAFVWYAGGRRTLCGSHRYLHESAHAAAQKYLFAWLLGHSPRHFQENFAGAWTEIKQAGRRRFATTSWPECASWSCFPSACAACRA
jgi:hypothetical protein